MNYIASITSQGQLTIPKSLRDKYGIKRQAKAIIQDTDTGILIKTFTDYDFWRLRGILKDNPVVIRNRARKMSSILSDEKKAFSKSVSSNAVSKTG